MRYDRRMDKIQIIFYKTSTGRSPFLQWLSDLDKGTESIIDARLNRARKGILGDCKPLRQTSGVWELRINYGPGYRLYFGIQGNTVIVLLVGGDKRSQERDIAKAERYWLDYKGLAK